jgi:hypothetical protein
MTKESLTFSVEVSHHHSERLDVVAFHECGACANWFGGLDEAVFYDPEGEEIP